MSAGRRYTIKGRVQGVYFRDSTRREAERLGVVGHALNLTNGDVEVVCYADAAALDELERWLRQGPPLARVTDIARVETDDATPPERFTTG